MSKSRIQISSDGKLAWDEDTALMNGLGYSQAEYDKFSKPFKAIFLRFHKGNETYYLPFGPKPKFVIANNGFFGAWTNPLGTGWSPIEGNHIQLGGYVPYKRLQKITVRVSSSRKYGVGMSVEKLPDQYGDPVYINRGYNSFTGTLTIEKDFTGDANNYVALRKSNNNRGFVDYDYYNGVSTGSGASNSSNTYWSGGPSKLILEREGGSWKYDVNCGGTHHGVDWVLFFKTEEWIDYNFKGFVTNKGEWVENYKQATAKEKVNILWWDIDKNKNPDATAEWPKGDKLIGDDLGTFTTVTAVKSSYDDYYAEKYSQTEWVGEGTLRHKVTHYYYRISHSHSDGKVGEYIKWI